MDATGLLRATWALGTPLVAEAEVVLLVRGIDDVWAVLARADVLRATPPVKRAIMFRSAWVSPFLVGPSSESPSGRRLDDVRRGGAIGALGATPDAAAAVDPGVDTVLLGMPKAECCCEGRLLEGAGCA